MALTRRLVLASVIGILLVILAGSIVRASGSGLGCPEWPRCFEESFFPPLTEEGIPEAYRDSEHVNLTKTWTEWLNRLAGALVGLLILAATIVAWLKLPDRRRLALLITGAGVLTAIQGWQGSLVVKYELDPRFVTLHLMTALAILFLLQLAWVALRGDEREFEQPGERGHVRGQMRLILILALLQFFLGALVRGTIDFIREEQPQLAVAARIAEVGFIETLHRGLAFVLTALVMLIATRIRSLGPKDALLARTATVSMICVGGQLAAGLALIEWELPATVQVLHISLGSLLLAALFLQERLLSKPLRI